MTEKMYESKKSEPPTTKEITEEVLKRAPPTRESLRHDPNRDLSEYIEDEDNDRLHIARSEYPDGMDLQWVTNSIFGQLQRQHRASFERKGWEPVLASDFDGRFGRQFMPDGWDGEVEVDGLVLMARPKKWSDKARENENREAQSRVNIKERQLRGGDIPGVGFDTQHPSALRTNVVKRSVETISVPSDKE